MKKFERHAAEAECSVDLKDVDDWDFEEGVGMSLPLVLTRELDYDAMTEQDSFSFDESQNGYWKLMLFHTLNKKFYMCFTYCGQREAFVLYFIHGEKVDGRFIAKVWFEEYDKPNPERKTCYLEVLPLNKVVDIDKQQYLPVQNYFLLSYAEMSQFFAIEPNEDDPEYPNEKKKHTIVIPVQVEGIRRVVEED